MKKYKIVIVGGGSTWTPGILKALCRMQDILALESVILYDIDAKRQEIIGKFGEILFKEEASTVNFSYTSDKKIAFSNVDFVFTQMRTGGYPMRELDEKIPLKYGVVGQETCGPGGFAYGMRSIKDMIELVNDVRLYSKQAWILNYTNPAAIVSIALKQAFPKDNKILNICDQPVNLLRSYGRLINRDYTSFEPRYFGLNHFGWFTNIYDEVGNDLAPLIKQTILNDGFIPVDAEQRDQSWLDTYATIKDMLEDFSEFLPNSYLQYYLYPEYKVAHSNPNFTRANEVMANREKKVFLECAKIVDAKTTKDSSVVHNDAHGDMIVELAASIAYNKKKTFIVIVENNGIVSNLDDDVMIEVAATITSNGPAPYNVGKIKTFYKGLIEQQHAYEKLCVEAYFNNSYQCALQALTLNRCVVDAKKARLILDELIIANKDYWPVLK